MNVKLFLIAEVVHPGASRCSSPCCGACPGPVFFPLRALAIVYIGPLPRHPDDPGDLHPGVRGAGAAAAGRAELAVLLGGRVAGARATRPTSPRCTGPGIESVHPSQTAAARSLGLSRWQSLRFVIAAAGGPARDPAAAERLHRPAEGHGAGRVDRRASRRSGRRRSTAPPRSTSRRILAAALLFVLITIPLARFTDWLIARERRRRQAGAAR